MTNNPRFHSNAPSNPNALYPRAVNSPLRYGQAIADDESGDDNEADANGESDTEES